MENTEELSFNEDETGEKRLIRFSEAVEGSLDTHLSSPSNFEEPHDELTNKILHNSKKYSVGICQWGVHGQGLYSAVPPVTAMVPAGVYKVNYSQQLGYHLSEQKTVLSDELLDLPVKEIREIVDDIGQFWEPDTKKKFREYDMTYKRGIIVFGPPGNGKSMMMQLVIKNLITQHDGVILTLDTVSAIENFIGFANTFRQIEPERPLVVILEDIDNVVEAGHSVLSALMNILDGVNQIDNVVYLACPAPETKILKTDLTWVRADSLVAGDELIGFDENGPDRRCRTSIVNSAPVVNRMRFKVVTDSGTIIVSEKHPFLVQFGKKQPEWITVEELNEDNRILSIGKPWETDTSYEGGYIAGQYDGEGTLGTALNKVTNSREFRVGWSQTIGLVADRFQKMLFDKGFNPDVCTVVAKRKSVGGVPHKTKNIVNIGGGKWENLRLLGTFRPTRLLAHPKIHAGWENCRICPRYTKVISVEPIGIGPVVALDTTTKTFIGEGMLQHNTTNYPEKLQERISNRPSRFDRKYEIGYPDADVRRAYILGKMKPEDQARQNIDMWVEKTEKFSISHIKELIVSVCILNKEFNDVLKHFAEMKKNRTARGSELGFGKTSY